MHIIKTIWVLLWGLAISTAEERTEEWLSDSYCRSVVEGDTGYIHFHFSELIDTASHGLFLFIKRNEGPDILRCTQTPRAQAADCDVLDDRFKTGGLVGMTLTLTIINATTDVQGLYVLRMTFPWNHRIDCNFTIPNKRDGKTNEHQTGQDVPIRTLVTLITVATLLAVLFMVVFICISRRRRYLRPLWKDSAGIHVCTARNTDAAAPTCSYAEEEGESLFGSPDSTTNKRPQDDHQNWHRLSSSTGKAEREPSTSASGDDSDEVFNSKKKMDMEEMALRIKEREPLLRNGQGSFLIRRSKTDPTEHLLAVTFDGGVEYFQIKQHGHIVGLEAANTSFNSLYDLKEYYKKHEIRTTEGVVYCRLSDTGTKDKRIDGYIHGTITEQEETDLLLRSGLSSFLIRRSLTGPNEILAVNCNRVVQHFTIVDCNTYFILQEAGTTFKSLPEMVEHYTRQKIKSAGGTFYCKLTHPCTRLWEEDSEKNAVPSKNGMQTKTASYNDPADKPSAIHTETVYGETEV